VVIRSRLPFVQEHPFPFPNSPKDQGYKNSWCGAQEPNRKQKQKLPPIS
jgi:hypothetical protein